MPTITLSEFSGGLNLRDSPNEVKLNETPDALNWTLDTRGQAKLRSGWTSVVTTPGDVSGSWEAYVFYSAALDQWLCVRNNGAGLTRLYTAPSNLSAWTDRGTLLNADARVVQAVDFSGTTPKAVIATNSSGGIYTWDGTTLTQVSSVVKGSAIAVWQNRVWVAGYTASDASGNPTRLFASKIGDPATWAVPDGLTVDLRDKDGAILTALSVVGGALMAFKQRSAYRISDSASGAYTTVDGAAGSLGAHSLAQLNGRLYTWGRDGIYEWDGIGPGRSIVDQVRPLFFPASANLDVGYIVRGGSTNKRLIFSYAPTGVAWSSELLEIDPSMHWAMKHQLSVTGGVSGRSVGPFTKKDDTLYAPVLGPNALYSVFTATAGTDGGAIFTSNFRTPWIQPARGKLSRILRAQVEGLLATPGPGPLLLNTLTLNVYTDWDLTAPSATFDISADLRGGDSGDQVETSVLQQLGHSVAFAFEFVAGSAAGNTWVNSLSLDWVTLEV